jgi:hypothetical protein
MNASLLHIGILSQMRGDAMDSGYTAAAVEV